MRTQVNRTAAFRGLVGAALLLTFGSAAQAQTVASDRGAGFIVFPKILSDPLDALNRGQTIDTVVQLTNNDPNSPHVVHCFYVNATGQCIAGSNAIDGPDCLQDSDCGLGGRCDEDIWSETNFTIILTPRQPTGWIVSEGRDVGVIENDPNAPGAGFGTVLPVPTDLFRGELKCVEVEDVTDVIPINSNDLKGEATTYVVEREPEPAAGTVQCNVCHCVNGETVCQEGAELMVCSLLCLPLGGLDGAQDYPSSCNVPPASEPQSGFPGCPEVIRPITSVDVRRYNGIGVQTLEEDDQAQNDRVLCLGANGIPGNVCEMAEYASCPEKLIVNHLFAADDENGFTYPNVTLVPCTEQLSTLDPTNLTIQIVLFNEFEQRFSLSTQIECLADIRLDEFSILYSIGTQGTVAGQSVFRAVADSSLEDGGFGLLGIAEQYTDAGSTAYNVVYSGTHLGAADIVSYVLPDPNTP